MFLIIVDYEVCFNVFIFILNNRMSIFSFSGNLREMWVFGVFLRIINFKVVIYKYFVLSNLLGNFGFYLS